MIASSGDRTKPRAFFLGLALAAMSAGAGGNAAHAADVTIPSDGANPAPAPRIRRATATELIVAAAACAPAWRQTLAAVCAATIRGAMPSSVGWFRLISQNATRQDGPALTSASASTPAAQPSSSSASKRAARLSHATRNSGLNTSRCRISRCMRRTAPSGWAGTSRKDAAALTVCRPGSLR